MSVTATEGLPWRGGEAGQQVPRRGRRAAVLEGLSWLRKNPEPAGPWVAWRWAARVGLGFSPLIFPSGCLLGQFISLVGTSEA